MSELQLVIDTGTIISGVILGVLLWGIKGTYGRLSDLTRNQAKLYTAEEKIKTWTEGHDIRDDERFGAVHDRIQKYTEKNEDEHKAIIDEIRGTRHGDDHHR